jgi:hypothetical protein
VSLRSNGSPLTDATSPSATKAKLRAMLLTVSNMPSGWTVDSSSESSSPPPSCLASYEKVKHHHVSVSADFVSGQGFPAFEESLASVGSKAHAEFVTVRKALAGCSHLTFSDQGEVFRGHISTMSFPRVGAESHAYAMTFAVQGTTVGFELVVFREGGIDGATVFGDIGSPDVATFTQLTDAAASKVSAGG